VVFIATNNPAVELKAAWRPLTAAEAASGRFHTATIRYYETNNLKLPCYREDVWGLVGLHIIAQTAHSPWVLWATFEQADNILTAGGQPTEDANGEVIVPQDVSPTSPALASDPSQLNPKVAIQGGQPYCSAPGSRLFFQENPGLSALPANGRICVNTRWHPISDSIIAVNQLAHTTLQNYLNTVSNGGAATSPWLNYKLVNVQAIPVNQDSVGYDPASYYTANSVIETDYSLGMFSGDLTNQGAPSNVQPGPGGQGTQPYYNTTLLPFQGVGAVPPQVNMGGCAGCHGFSAQTGRNFSFALGNNVLAPESSHPFSFKAYKGLKGYLLQHN
jgi:hypothetical protein